MESGRHEFLDEARLASVLDGKAGEPVLKFCAVSARGQIAQVDEQLGGLIVLLGLLGRDERLDLALSRGLFFGQSVEVLFPRASSFRLFLGLLFGGAFRLGGFACFAAEVGHIE